MVELVRIHNTIKLGSEVVNTVNARDLHKVLEVNKKFTDWIKYKIDKLGSKEGVDYVIIESESNVSASQNWEFEGMEQNGAKSYNINNLVKKVKEYYITLEMAKHIAMMEANSRGNMVRDYFIECEKIAMEAVKEKFKIPRNYKEALLEIVHQLDRVEQLQLENQEKQKLLEYQTEKADNYEYAEKERRYKQELTAKFNKTVRTLAEQKFACNYATAYTYVYGEFDKAHCFNQKIDINFLKKNNDYLAECLKITTSELE